MRSQPKNFKVKKEGDVMMAHVRFDTFLAKKFGSDLHRSGQVCVIDMRKPISRDRHVHMHLVMAHLE
jgi:hypothetical protein